MNKKNEQFIERATTVHGDKYDYSKVAYKNCDTKVCIICPIHGEFYQTPYLHNHGCGCPLCGKEKSDKAKTSNTPLFIEKSIKKHNSKYNYSKVNYINNSTKVCIMCPEHGEFWQTPSSHLKGSGCPKCYNKKKLTLFNHSKKQFIERATTVHGDKYDYSKVIYTNARKKVCIICPEHGEFWQTPTSHNRGCGCPKCALENKRIIKLLDINKFIENAKKMHGNKYDYSKAIYIGAKEKIEILCPIHGEFWQTPDAHMHGSGCQKCANNTSQPEIELFNFFKNNFNVEIEHRNREKIAPFEIDLFFPNKQIGIEYNGLYWHCDKFQKEKTHLLNKTILCQKQNIKLIHIFEDEWVNKKDIVLAKLKHILKLSNNPKIMARKTIIKEIDKHIAKNFLEQYHIQGNGIASLYYGAFYNNSLIAVMSFKKEGIGKWELNRFATDYNYICNGVGGKLFKYFINQNNPIEVKSFADKRWTLNEINNFYTKIGFKYGKTLPPDYHYVKENETKRYHKFNLRKKNLLKKFSKKYQIDENMTESEMTKKIGIYRIYDCGLIKYVWKKFEI